jgi:hypothetical protein
MNGGNGGNVLRNFFENPGFQDSPGFFYFLPMAMSIKMELLRLCSTISGDWIQ